MQTCQIVSPLFPRPVGKLIWELAQPYRMIDRKGRDWLIPRGFRFNGYSVPRLAWWFRPPLDGSLSDGAACLHDFHWRCRNLLGLSWRDLQNTFLHAMIDLGTRRKKARIKWGATWAAIPFAGSEGMGLTGDEDYDHPVWGGMGLPDWVLEHYPDGPRPYDPTGGSALL
jgi:hypothetical protein